MSFAMQEIHRIAAILAADAQLRTNDLHKVVVQADACLNECRKWNLPVPLETYKISKILSATMRLREAGARQQ